MSEYSSNIRGVRVSMTGVAEERTRNDVAQALREHDVVCELDLRNGSAALIVSNPLASPPSGKVRAARLRGIPCVTLDWVYQRRVRLDTCHAFDIRIALTGMKVCTTGLDKGDRGRVGSACGRPPVTELTRDCKLLVRPDAAGANAAKLKFALKCGIPCMTLADFSLCFPPLLNSSTRGDLRWQQDCDGSRGAVIAADSGANSLSVPETGDTRRRRPAWWAESPEVAAMQHAGQQRGQQRPAEMEPMTDVWLWSAAPDRADEVAEMAAEAGAHPAATHDDVRITHVLVPDDAGLALDSLGGGPLAALSRRDGVEWVRARWLHDCVSRKHRVSCVNYRVQALCPLPATSRPVLSFSTLSTQEVAQLQSCIHGARLAANIQGLMFHKRGHSGGGSTQPTTHVILMRSRATTSTEVRCMATEFADTVGPTAATPLPLVDVAWVTKSAERGRWLDWRDFTVPWPCASADGEVSPAVPSAASENGLTSDRKRPRREPGIPPCEAPVPADGRTHRASGSPSSPSSEAEAAAPLGPTGSAVGAKPSAQPDVYVAGAEGAPPRDTVVTTTFMDVETVSSSLACFLDKAEEACGMHAPASRGPSAGPVIIGGGDHGEGEDSGPCIRGSRAFTTPRRTVQFQGLSGEGCGRLSGVPTLQRQQRQSPLDDCSQAVFYDYSPGGTSPWRPSAEVPSPDGDVPPPGRLAGTAAQPPEGEGCPLSCTFTVGPVLVFAEEGLLCDETWAKLQRAQPLWRRAEVVEECTHFVSVKLVPTRWLLSCLAQGKWVLQPSFLAAAADTTRSTPLEPEAHEWTAAAVHRNKLGLPGVRLAAGCKLQRCAAHRAAARAAAAVVAADNGDTSRPPHRHRPFSHWRVTLTLTGNRLVSFQRVLECGGCTHITTTTATALAVGPRRPQAGATGASVIRVRSSNGCSDADGQEEDDSGPPLESLVLSDESDWELRQLTDYVATDGASLVLVVDYLLHFLCTEAPDVSAYVALEWKKAKMNANWRRF